MTLLEGRRYALCDVLQALFATHAPAPIMHTLYKQYALECGMREGEYEWLFDTCSKTPVDQIIGNRRFGLATKQLASLGFRIDGISRDRLVNLGKLAANVPSKEKLESLHNRITSLQAAINRGRETDPKDRLSIAEMKLAEAIARSSDFITELQECEETIYDANGLIRGISDAIKEWQNLADDERRYRPGTIISYDPHNMWAHRGFGGKAPLLGWVSATLLRQKSEHLSIGLCDEGRSIEAHVWERYRYERQPLSSRVFNSYVIDVRALGEKDEAEFRMLYGDEWEARVREIYGEVARTFYIEEQKRRQVTNPHSRKAEAIVEPRWTLPTDWRHKMQFRENKAICSEYAVKSLLHTVDALNKRIAGEWKEAGHQGDSPELTPPVRSYRSLEKIVPSAVMTRLAYLRIVEEERPLPLIGKIIIYRPYTLRASTIDQVINSPLFAFVSICAAAAAFFGYTKWQERLSRKRPSCDCVAGDEASRADLD
jgi:hypothetical protein